MPVSESDFSGYIENACHYTHLKLVWAKMSPLYSRCKGALSNNKFDDIDIILYCNEVDDYIQSIFHAVEITISGIEIKGRWP